MHSLSSGKTTGEAPDWPRVSFLYLQQQIDLKLTQR